jgi:hypothetical protein
MEYYTTIEMKIMSGDGNINKLYNAK